MSGRYLLRRLLQVVPTVLGIVILTFVLVHAAPGDPARNLAGEGADEAQVEALSEELGLDRPLPTQFARWSGRLLRGDLGNSFVYQRPVTELIGRRLSATLLLTGSALVLSTLVGIALGQVAARRPHGPADTAVSTFALVGYSLPAFWLAQLAILAVALKLDLLPAGGMTDARAGYTGAVAVVDVARHLVLPGLVLAISEVALITRIARSGLIGQMGSDYLRAARAKGLPEDKAVTRHALPNALLPVVTVVGSRVGFLVSGAVLVESVFAWPGLGSLLVEAARAGDHPVILGMVLLVSCTVVTAAFATDLVYAWLDPRIRYR